VNRVTLRNRIATQTLAFILDMPGPVRRLALNRVVNEAPPLSVLLAEEELLEEHIRRTVTGVWHPTGTCRMGRDDDPEAVTDSTGRVRGAAGLRVADNSIIPEIPRANTTLPAVMIGERMADLVLASGRT
jgi:5-(hydroxymethyl)furfural/furfural oxidase